MKYIKKGKDPKSLEEHRTTPGATFDGSYKKDIREALVKEQGGLCAYCMKRIKAHETDKKGKYLTHIEHYQSQENYPELSLKYANMLAVCNGNEGQPKTKQHCDKSKGSKNLIINPLDKSCEQLVKFLGNGKILVDDNNSKIKRDIEEALNLNESGLVNSRKVALDVAINNLASQNKKSGKGGWSIAALKKERAKWVKPNKDGNYKAFCQAVISYLDKKINSSQK